MLYEVITNLPDETFDAARIAASDQQDQSAAKGSFVSSDADRDQKRVPHINVGSGKDIRINELAETIQAVVGYRGAVIWDPSMPDGVITSYSIHYTKLYELH